MPDVLARIRGGEVRSEKIIIELPAERKRVDGEDELRGTRGDVHWVLEGKTRN